MIDFVSALPFLRIPLQVANATMHFHILARTVSFLGNFFLHDGGPRKQFGTHEKMSLEVQVRLNKIPV